MYLTFRYNNTIISDFIRRYNNLVCISEIRYTASMKITILCVGKIKEKFYTDAIAEYEKTGQIL